MWKRTLKLIVYRWGHRGAAVVVRRRRREKRLRVLGNRGFFLGFSELSLLGFNDHGTLAVVSNDLCVVTFSLSVY